MTKRKTLSIVSTRRGPGGVHLGDGRIVRSDPVDVDEDQALEAIDAGVCRLVDHEVDGDPAGASGPDAPATD